MTEEVRDCIFEIECVNYCIKHKIETLNATTLANCFLIPSKGVRVKYLSFEDVYYPIINGTYLDNKAKTFLGTYCERNNRVVFVYRNGKTYVTKGRKIVDELKKAGYREKSMLVPFSHGEKIFNSKLADKWNQIKE